MPFALLALCGGLALGGCESQAEAPPTTAPPSATASSPAPSPSVTASPSVSASSQVPAAAREKTEKGAEAFVRFFFEELNRAWTTPSPGVIDALSDEGCQFCSKSEDDALALESKGHRYLNDPVTVDKLMVMTGAAPPGQVFLRTELRQNKSDIVDRSGSVISTDPARTVTLISGVVWSGGRWQMYEVESQ